MSTAAVAAVAGIAAVELDEAAVVGEASLVHKPHRPLHALIREHRLPHMDPPHDG